MTDGTSTSGYIDIATQIPAGSIVLGWKAVAASGFTGNGAASIQVGTPAGTGAFSTTTTGVVATATTVGSASVLATSFTGTDTTARITITGTSDFTLITTGTATVTIFYAH